MAITTQPVKEAARDYFQRRTLAPQEPSPTPDEILQQLGLDLIPANRGEKWAKTQHSPAGTDRNRICKSLYSLCPLWAEEVYDSEALFLYNLLLRL